MKYLIAAVTDVGVRREKNQDSMFVKRVNFKGEQLVLAVLCDGMGGLQKGETASASIIRAFQKWFDQRLLQLLLNGALDQQLFDSWDQLIAGLNQKIYQYGVENKVRLGTTLTAMLFWKKKYYVVHVGDSRAYERKNRLRQITRDQTLVQREIERGMLDFAQARYDTRRNILLQCIGASKTVRPDHMKGTVSKDAVYLICCDGFCRLIEEAEITEAFDPKKMVGEQSLEKTGKRLIQLNKERGEQDNISVIAIRTQR